VPFATILRGFRVGRRRDGQPLQHTPSLLVATPCRAVARLAATRRNGSRWSVALALGLRQGEALGLRWQHVDLDAGTLTIRWQLQRLAWRHGCADPHTCGKDRHHDDCPPDCTSHARTCPNRTGGGLRLTELKSEKSRRTIALPPPARRGAQSTPGRPAPRAHDCRASLARWRFRLVPAQR
jgi:integrase